ncbi:hypothetical protein BDV28DRAFT_134690 [Aspergillus coremiiformis]|uniref:Required for respiratory growth protein 9, mitochondrial n=1 Tax=Aspergillus coremiiformis TaxID=138285 RepID=A0A5N6Z4S5_9EURO|nr:hypothetical protein BDV28DRAFT_134690 [Aspergillus coremiiformis]
MVTFCARSAKLTLPALLRNVYRSDFAPELHSLRDTQGLVSQSRAPYSHQSYNNSRKFTPRSRLRVASDENAAARTASQNPTTPVTKANSPSQVKSDKTSTKSSRNKKHERGDHSLNDFTPKKKKEHWQIQKEALKKKFTGGWNPSKKLSPDALDGIRHLHAAAPEHFTTPILAEKFQVSPEAIRRILKSNWRPSADEMEDRRKRWEKRHDRIWSHLSELGLRPKTKRTEDLADTKILYDQRDKDSKSPE